MLSKLPESNLRVFYRYARNCMICFMIEQNFSRYGYHPGGLYGILDTGTVKQRKTEERIPW